jgi:hypothetical protein
MREIHRAANWRAISGSMAEDAKRISEVNAWIGSAA